MTFQKGPCCCGKLLLCQTVKIVIKFDRKAKTVIPWGVEKGRFFFSKKKNNKKK